jgi:pimeloyl-ACP methyl ester carboxylesterase
MRAPTRRSVLAAGALTTLAGGAYGLMAAGVLPDSVADALPGKGRLDRALGRCGELPVPPAAAPGPVEIHTLRMSRGRPVRAVVGWPPGSGPGTPLPVTVLLHGGNGDARTPFDGYAIHRYLADAVTRRRTRPFAVAAVDDWATPGTVTDELLPYLAGRRLRAGGTDRIALLGWSIGGDGALSLATRLGPGRTAAVVATSPAITRASARSYARGLAGIPVWAGCGRSDSLAGPTEELLAALRDANANPAGGIYPGCHDSAFRRRMLMQQMTFLGTHLA